jgi:ribosomal RNA-processing protein 36
MRKALVIQRGELRRLTTQCIPCSNACRASWPSHLQPSENVMSETRLRPLLRYARSRNLNQAVGGSPINFRLHVSNDFAPATNAMAPVQRSRLELRDFEDDGEEYLDLDSKNASGGDDGSISSGGDYGDEIESDEDDFNEAEEEVEQRVLNVSFGALKQAQDSLARKRKRGSDTTAEQEGKLDALRERLNEIRSKSKRPKDERNLKRSDQARAPVQDGSHSGKARAVAADENDYVDSDSAPSEEENSRSRTSKHAPASQSSRRPVTRKREVVDVPKRKFRDPRFHTLQHQSAQEGNSAKAYSFLRDYEKDEIAELKTAIKQSRNEYDKETLKRKMISMQNRIKSQEAKEREQDILRQHRRGEKEKVEQGKKPFYLKRKDLKERAMVEKFKGMKSKDREKLIEKRRRKEDQKEKRRMPGTRRLNG